jgi:hypothetical protein
MYVRIEFETAGNDAHQTLTGSPSGCCTDSQRSINLGGSGPVSFFYLDDEILATQYRGVESVNSLQNYPGVKSVTILPVEGDPHTLSEKEFYAHRDMIKQTYL